MGSPSSIPSPARSPTPTPASSSCSVVEGYDEHKGIKLASESQRNLATARPMARHARRPSLIRRRSSRPQEVICLMTTTSSRRRRERKDSSCTRAARSTLPLDGEVGESRAPSSRRRSQRGWACELDRGVVGSKSSKSSCPNRLVTRFLRAPG